MPPNHAFESHTPPTPEDQGYIMFSCEKLENEEWTYKKTKGIFPGNGKEIISKEKSSM